MRYNTNRVVNNTDGSIVGYKYFNFTDYKGKNDVWLLLGMKPEGIDGKIEVYLDRPWAKQGGKLVGTLNIKADMPQASAETPIKLDGMTNLDGKHAIYLVFSSPTKEKSICTLETISFAAK